MVKDFSSNVEIINQYLRNGRVESNISFQYKESLSKPFQLMTVSIRNKKVKMPFSIVMKIYMFCLIILVEDLLKDYMDILGYLVVGEMLSGLAIHMIRKRVLLIVCLRGLVQLISRFPAGPYRLGNIKLNFHLHQNLMKLVFCRCSWYRRIFQIG